ncbi:MAG: hypothetical protein OXK78_02745 [Caldilineaceae bacterium]|nr:hypothetical protein [Caldilineaceae bacterium]
MNQILVEQLKIGQSDIMPRFKALQAMTSALKQGMRLTSQEKLDALPMQKALAKFEAALQAVEEQGLVTDELLTIHKTFADVTQQALEAVAFDFARDLRELFETQGETVSGRPPTVVVGELILQLDTNARRGQWFYGKEALTKPLALSFTAIPKAYHQQKKQIVERQTDAGQFLQELYNTWNELIEQRSRYPVGGRINVIEIYSKMVLNRQNPRFWNQPSRRTFRDYERVLFVRDLVLAQKAGALVNVDGKALRLRLGVATKSQAEQANRSVWIPNGPLDGVFYADIFFEEDNPKQQDLWSR